MERVIAAVLRLTRREDGQDLVEYGILAALIAVICVVAVTAVGNQINTVLWQTIVQNF
jgi:pilus assembly protein Flp/PilA